MKHAYELRKFEDDESMTTVLKITAEPKYAKQRAEDYTKRHPGMYALQKIETVRVYYNEEE
nr:MAG TPA: hypothetical protein [Microviridae sp.]